MKHKIFLFILLFLAISFSKLHAESDTLWTTQIGSTVRTVKFSPDGQYVYAAAIDRGIIKINAQNGDIIQEFLGFKYENEIHHNALDVSNDGKHILGGEYFSLYLFNSVDGSIIKQFETGLDKNQNIKFNDAKLSKDNKYVFGMYRYTLGNSTNYSLSIWELETNKLIKTITILMGTILEVSPNNNLLAYIGKQANSENYDIALLEIGTWKEIGLLKGHTSRITDLSFSPDGSLLASCDDKFIKIWDIKNNSLKINFKPESVTIFSLQLFNSNLLTIGNGDIDNYKIRTNDIFNNSEIYNIPLIPLDFEYFKNEKIIVADYKRVTLVKADRLTSVATDFTKGIIYPNPATNLLTIPKTFFENSFISLNISDITGKTFYSNDTNQNEDLIIDVSNYPKGTYYINYNYKSGSQSTRFVNE